VPATGGASARPTTAARPAEGAASTAGPPAGPADAVTDEERRRSLYDALAGAGPGPASSPVEAGARPAPTVPRVRFSGDLTDARRAVAGFGSGALAVLLVTTLLGLPLLLALVGAAAVGSAGLARVRRLFLLTPEAQAAQEVGAVLAAPRQVAGDAVAAVDHLARRRAEIARREEAAAQKASRERATMRAKEEAELRDVDAALEATLADLVARERAIAKAEHDARAAALKELQTSVVDAQLAQHSLVAAAAAGGVSDQVVYRLALDDVRTAADFTDVTIERKRGVVVRRDGRRLQVNGIDQHQAAAMLQWRRRMTGVAQLKAPDSLPRERLAAIRAEHDALRSSLAAAEEAARADARRQADEVRARWEGEHDAIVQRQKQVEADANRQRVELDRDLAHAHKNVAEAEWRLGRHEEESGVPVELRLADYLRQVVAVGPLAGLLDGPARTHTHRQERRPSSRP
jgi:hypothetical protein